MCEEICGNECERECESVCDERVCVESIIHEP